MSRCWDRNEPDFWTAAIKVCASARGEVRPPQRVDELTAAIASSISASVAYLKNSIP